MMAQAFSVSDKNTFLDVEEVGGSGNLIISLETPDKTLAITVEAGDLARAILTASPSFARGVGEIAQRAIIEYLSVESETTEP